MNTTPPPPAARPLHTRHGVRRCGAHARSTGLPCRRPVLPPSVRCRNHGGPCTGLAIAAWQARLEAPGADVAAVVRELREYARRSRAAALVLAAVEAADTHTDQSVHKETTVNDDTDTATDTDDDAPESESADPTLTMARRTLESIANDALVLPRDRVLAASALHRARRDEIKAENEAARLEQAVDLVIAKIKPLLSAEDFERVVRRLAGHEQA